MASPRTSSPPTSTTGSATAAAAAGAGTPARRRGCLGRLCDPGPKDGGRPHPRAGRPPRAARGSADQAAVGEGGVAGGRGRGGGGGVRNRIGAGPTAAKRIVERSFRPHNGYLPHGNRDPFKRRLSGITTL